MAYPTTTVEIAKYQMGPLVKPEENAYVTFSGATSDAASYAFTTGNLLDLTNNYTITVEIEVPFVDPADFAGTDPTVAVVEIDQSGTKSLEFGVIFNVGDDSGGTTGVMYGYLNGTGYIYSDPVPALNGIDATPARLILQYAVNGSGELTFSSRNLNVDTNEFASITSGTFDGHGTAVSFGSRSSANGSFLLGPSGATNTPARFRRCRLPGTAETDFQDHDGSGTYTDASRTWTVNNSAWRAGDWVDVSSLVRYGDGITVTRGRTSDLGAYAPGVCSFVLDNQARGWDPYGSTDVKPWQQVRVQATYASTPRTVFYGYVRAYTPSFDNAGLFPLTRVDCVDAFGLFANRNIGTTTTAAALELAPVGYWPHTEAASSTVITNAVFGQPDLEYSFSSKTAGTDPMWIGGRRTGTFSPDGHVAAADLPAEYAATGSFTVAAWVHMPEPDATGLVSGDRTGVLTVANTSEDFWFSCYLYNDGRNQWGAGVAFYNGSTNTYNDGALCPALNDTLWPAGTAGTEDDKSHHVAWVVNSGGTYDFDIYVDGQLVGSTSGVTAPTTPTGSALLFDGDLRSDSGGTLIDSLGLTGSAEKTVAGIGYWDRALTANEVRSLADSFIDGFVSETSNARVNRLLRAFGWRRDLLNIQTGEVTLAAVDADGSSYLAALQRAELTEFGDLFMAPNGTFTYYGRDYRTDSNNTTQETFDDAATASPFARIEIDYSDEQVINVAQLTGTNGTVTARDEPSIRAGYGVRQFSRSVDAEVSQAQASQIVTRFAQPQPRPRTFTIRPTRDEANLFPAVLDRDITDKVSITIPTLGTDPTVTARISRVQHFWNGHEWTTTWGLEVEP